MQAIITKFIGPTNIKGARIKASASAGSVTIPFPYELNLYERHEKAARALLDKLGWDFELASGDLPDGSTVFVCLPKKRSAQ
jgi:hypothetical protein